MKSILVPLTAVLMSGTAFAGPMATLKTYVPGEVPAAVAVPAPVAASVRLAVRLGETDGNFCFSRGASFAADDSYLPKSFCISKVALERTAGGNMTLAVAADNKDMKGGKAEYVFENGVIKYVKAKIFEFFNEQTWGIIELNVPVYPNGNIIPGAAVKPAARAGINNNGDWQFTPVEYSKPKPPTPPVAPAISGSCFVRASDEWADEVSMPVKFCVKGLALVRENDGSLGLNLAGELSGKFNAFYVTRGGMTYAQAEVFGRDTGNMTSYSGTITLLVPVYANGELDAKGQALVDATSGYNWDIYHGQWEYRAVKFATVAE